MKTAQKLAFQRNSHRKMQLIEWQGALLTSQSRMPSEQARLAIGLINEGENQGTVNPLYPNKKITAAALASQA